MRVSVEDEFGSQGTRGRRGTARVFGSLGLDAQKVSSFVGSSSPNVNLGERTLGLLPEGRASQGGLPPRVRLTLSLQYVSTLMRLGERLVAPGEIKTRRGASIAASRPRSRATRFRAHSFLPSAPTISNTGSLHRPSILCKCTPSLQSLALAPSARAVPRYIEPGRETARKQAATPQQATSPTPLPLSHRFQALHERRMH